MIDVTGLTKNYGDHKALDNISFNIKKGEIVGFLGPNGAGKSTTMKILTGFMPPTEGKVMIAGKDMDEHSLELRKRIGYLPEANPLYMDFTVEEFLSYVMHIRAIPKEKQKDALKRAVEICGLKDVFYKGIATLSKGYKQRVGLAQALIHNPDILILDEPTSGLDPKQILEIRDLIAHIGKSHTVLLSTHILQEVKAMCSRVMVINKGQIVAKDTIENLEANAKGGGVVEVSFKGGSEKSLQQQLTELKGVKEVRHDTKVKEGSHEHNFHISVEKGEDIREALFDFAVKHDLKLLKSTPSKVDLEDVFIQLTQ